MATYKIVLGPATGSTANLTFEIDAPHKIYLSPNGVALIPNGGGEYTTDWINPTDGLAQYWLLYQNA